MRLLLLYPALVLLLGLGVTQWLLPANAQPASVLPPVTPLPISRDDTFVFVQGCVGMPGDQGNACPNPPEVDWQHYLDFLRDALHLNTQQFGPWRDQHVRFARARTADPSVLEATLATVRACLGAHLQHGCLIGPCTLTPQTRMSHGHF